MSKTLSGLIALAILFVFSTASPALAAELKIGVANLQSIASQCKANKEAEKKLKDTFSEEKNQLDKLGAEIEKLTDEMKKQSAALSAEAKQAKRANLVQMMRDHNDKSRVFVNKVKDAENIIRKEILAAIMIAAKEYAEKNGYNMILDNGLSGVLYSSESMDVTRPLLQEVDRVWETSAARAKN